MGVVLAGGSGARMGGSKATVELHGRPLITYPIEAMWRALGHAVVVAKPETELPNLPGVTVWAEPAERRHPLIGLVHALKMADARPVVVCAADLPFVTAELVRHLAGGARGALAAIATAGDTVQPLLGWYHPRTLAPLRELAAEARISVREAVGRLGPAHVDVGDPDLLFNVNTPSDLLQAAAMMDAWARRAAASPGPSRT